LSFATAATVDDGASAVVDAEVLSQISRQLRPPGISRMPSVAESIRVQSGDISLAGKIWRNAEKPTLILVHGYPDDHLVWERVIPLLVADFQVVAYDVRGHGLSDAPRSVNGYRLEHLVEDLATVVRAVSPSQPVHLVAHDWGSIQSWEAVMTDRLQGRIASYVSISGPSFDHAAFWFRRSILEGGWKGLRSALGQLARSWYMFFFELPWLPNLVWHWILVPLWPRLLLRNEGIRVDPSPHQLRNSLNGIDLYRANFLPRMLRPQPRYANIPVLLIVPTRDPYISPRLYEELPHWVGSMRREEVSCGHWLPLKEPEKLAMLIRSFVEQP
jgi:pimeloyl-ACP methyl ester carboxylesterase